MDGLGALGSDGKGGALGVDCARLPLDLPE
jgi:hypothetical protein